MFCLNGTGSTLNCDIFPPIELDGAWELGLIDFMTYNSIPNIEEGVNNIFYFGEEKIVLPTGSYEIEDINEYINDRLPKNQGKKKIIKMLIRANNNTLKSEIYSSVAVDFTKPNSLASVLGFRNIKLEPNKWHTSPSTISIIKTDVIRVVCNIVSGSLKNGVESHILHEFYPTVGPGYKLVEIPTNVIYLPVNTSRLHNITIRLEDQNGNLVNFRGETITLRLHLRRQDGSNLLLRTK